MYKAMRRAYTAAVTLLAWPVLAAVAPMPAAPAPVLPLTVEQVVARNVDARGGLEHWRAIRNMVWTGHMEGASADMPLLRFRLDQARPNRTRFEVNAMGQRSVRVFDGFNGWKQKPGASKGDVEPFSLEEVRFAQEEPAIDGPLIDYAAHNSHVSLSGMEDVQGKRAYRVDVVRASGAHESVWVDADTFLESRYDRISYNPAGKPVLVSVYYHDYREFAGVRVPTRIDIGGSEGAPANRMVIEQVDLNASLDPRNFSSPDAAHRHAGSGMNTQSRRDGRGDTLPAWAQGERSTQGAKSPAGIAPATSPRLPPGSAPASALANPPAATD